MVYVYAVNNGNIQLAGGSSINRFIDKESNGEFTAKNNLIRKLKYFML
jgi:hypothetical protein